MGRGEPGGPFSDEKNQSRHSESKKPEPKKHSRRNSASVNPQHSLSKSTSYVFPRKPTDSPQSTDVQLTDKTAVDPPTAQRGTQPRIKDMVPGSASDRKTEVQAEFRGKLSDFEENGRPTGLDNLGNTCYMNSVLQCFARTPDFLELLELEPTDPLLASLATLLRAYRNKRDLLPELRGFRKELGAKLPKFKGNKQEDAKDLILELMNYIEKVDRPAAALFYGLRVDKITCLKCGNQIPAEAELFLVPVERQRALDVTSYLNRAQNDEFQLTGENKLKCSVCESQSDASVVTKIVGAPNVLIVYIEPFDIYGKRIKQTVSYTERVALLGRKYQLFGVVCHHGSSIHSGHFTAKVKYRQWFQCDDAYVTQLTSLSNSEAYFLFYESQPFD